MFTVIKNKFDQHLQLQHSIAESYFSARNVMYFDNDGFELTLLERSFYEAHNISTENILNHECDQKEWITGGNDNFKIDHCLLLQRREFVDEARHQILRHQRKLPQLAKFLKIVPKWGIDFALDYYDDDNAVEVLHIENDYRSYDEAQQAKDEIEQRILNTDWHDFTNSIIQQKEQWINLKGFAQNDWKAVYWGLSRAEVTQKSYTGQ